MIHATLSKTINVAPPGAIVNNASVTCLAVDRKDFDYAVFKIVLGSTDASLTALKLQESDDNSTFADVAGLDYSLAPAALPTASDGNHVFSFDVDLRGRKRYLKPVVTVGTGATEPMSRCWLSCPAPTRTPRRGLARAGGRLCPPNAGEGFTAETPRTRREDEVEVGRGYEIITVAEKFWDRSLVLCFGC